MAELTIQKRRSGTISGAERITGVKNAQAEMLLSRRLTQYQSNYKKTQLNIQLQEYRFEHDAKLLTLDSKTNDLEYKKRLYPNSDLSHEETTVHKLKKYLVRNAEKLCYLDKGLSHNIRNQSSATRVPTVVADARMTLRRKQLLKELDESRLRMYDFFRSRNDTNDNETESMSDIDDDVEEEGELDRALKHNQVTFPEAPQITVRPSTDKHQKTMKEKLKANPVVIPAFEAYKQQKEEQSAGQPRYSPTFMLSRIARMKPLTKTQMMEETAKVQSSVSEFNSRIEELIWQFKQEEFQQGLKFVKDKDTEWNKFMEEMNARNRGNDQERPQTTPIFASTQRHVITSYAQRRPLTESQKRSLLKENLLLGLERKQQAPSKPIKGIPHHVAERLSRNSISAQLQRMITSQSPELKQQTMAAK